MKERDNERWQKPDGRQMNLTRNDCAAMDVGDPLAHARERFCLPKDIIYLDGNSLGALPRATPDRIAKLLTDEWGDGLVRSWNMHDWIGMPARLGAKIAALIGAESGEVIVADSTSVNLFKLAGAAMRLQSPRRIVLSERGNFPTDIYVLQGLEALLGGTVTLRLVERDEIPEALGDDIALLVLTHIHYKSGELHDMRTLTARAHACGALVLWDLSHSAGATELFLDFDGVDLAVGCGYKYLNGGPGAPAFVYVAGRLQGLLQPPLSGWMGHASPFEFGDEFVSAAGIKRQLCGTPAIISMAALGCGLSTFDGVDMRDVRSKSIALGDLMLALVGQYCPGIEIACPADGKNRGSQIALRHAQGYAIMQALISRGVIGDFRAPDIVRFGFSPLYVRFVDIWDAVATLAEILADDSWSDPRFQSRSTVT
ncbi:MAG TPA: kynureninase [Rhizomicrobium sp.]|jgi:kynureninase